MNFENWGVSNMYELMIIGGIVTGVLFIVMFILQFIDSFSGVRLQKKFVRLGILKGLHYDDIVNEVGRPNAISNIQNGQIVAQWISNGYHIALIFDKNDVCLGISSQTSI